MQAELDKKVQFVYEIAFARRELDGLGVKYELKLEDTIQFEIKQPYDTDYLVKRLAHFGRIGQTGTEYSSNIVSRNIKRSDNQYLTHWYYPYKGKYHPRLVRSIFNIVGLRWGETILDPFVGSGTTTLEAHLFGLNSIGLDISPLTVIVSKVKVTAGEVAEELHSYLKEATNAMSYDYGRVSKRSLGIQKLVVDSEGSSYKQFLESISDERIRNFYLLAQLIFASDRGRRKREFSSFEKNLDSMITSALDLAAVEKEIRQDRPPTKVDLSVGDARKLQLQEESIDGIITSPPYSIALNYMENDKFALEELGIDIKQLSDSCVGVRGKGHIKLESYDSDMQASYTEMHRVLKPGCYCVVVIGEAKVDGYETKSVEKAIDFCERKLGFTLTENLPKKIFGLYNTINDERVLFFRK